MRVLLSDGSGTTSREAALQLAAAGHSVGVLSPTPLCLARFSTSVQRWHRMPGFGADPHRWLTAAIAHYRRGRYDVLLPTEGHVAVLSWAAARGLLGEVRTIVPPFAELRLLQDKISAWRTLNELDVPQPRTTHVRRLAGVVTWDDYPIFLKLPIGAGATGIRVDSAADLPAAVARVSTRGAFEDSAGTSSGVLVQHAVPGPLIMVQGIFDRGRLVALHASLRLPRGVGSGGSHRASCDPGEWRNLIESLGGSLGWHGALRLDIIQGPAGPVVVDVDPRLVEPGNAWASGTDLVSPLVELALGGHPVVQAVGQLDVRTHQLLPALLEASAQGRAALLRELRDAQAGRRDYARSTEELTPDERDPRAQLPVAVAVASCLATPEAARALAARGVSAHALTAEIWQSLTESDQD